MALSIDPPMSSIDEDLNHIERDIRTLKIEYEQYFGGGRKRPPADTQWRVDSLIRRCSERLGDLNYGQRFRLNNLLQTYAKYQDMWRKKLAQKESASQQRHFGAAARAIEAERARAASHLQADARGRKPVVDHKRTAETVPVFALRFDLAPQSADADTEDGAALVRGKIEELYRKLIEARTQTGERAGAPSMQNFEDFVQQKMREVRAKGAHHVEYSVSIESGHVKLRARILM